MEEMTYIFMHRRIRLAMIITDYYELLALYKTILEAKFHPDPYNNDIAGSPIVSNLLKRILSEIIDEQSKQGKCSIEEWDNWLKICNHMTFNKNNIGGMKTVWEIAIMNAQKDERFFSNSSQEKLRKIAECYLCPFECTVEELDLFINCVKKQE